MHWAQKKPVYFLCRILEQMVRQKFIKNLTLKSAKNQCNLSYYEDIYVELFIGGEESERI